MNVKRTRLNPANRDEFDSRTPSPFPSPPGEGTRCFHPGTNDQMVAASAATKIGPPLRRRRNPRSHREKPGAQEIVQHGKSGPFPLNASSLEKHPAVEHLHSKEKLIDNDNSAKIQGEAMTASTIYIPSKLLPGETEILRAHTFTRWMSPDLT